MAEQKTVILGASWGGLAAGTSGLPVLDPGTDGPTGTVLAYCVRVGESARIYSRTRSSEWRRPGDIAARAYQFTSNGLRPMYDPSPVVLEWLRRYGSVAAMQVVCGDQRRERVMNGGALSIADDGRDRPGYFMLDAAHTVDEVSKQCNIRHGYGIASVDRLHRTIYFNGHPSVKYEVLFFTLPLMRMYQYAFGYNPPNAVECRPINVVNIGVRLTDEPEVDFSSIHQLICDRSAETMIDAIDFYSSVDEKSFVPVWDHKPRLGMAVKHWCGANELSPRPATYKNMVRRGLTKLGIAGEIEAEDHHYDYSTILYDTSEDFRRQMLWQLAKFEIFPLGSAANGLPQNLSDDILQGLAVASLA